MALDTPREFLEFVKAQYRVLSEADGTVEGKCSIEYEKTVSEFLNETIRLGGTGNYSIEDSKKEIRFSFWSPIR